MPCRNYISPASQDLRPNHSSVTDSAAVGTIAFPGLKSGLGQPARFRVSEKKFDRVLPG